MALKTVSVAWLDLSLSQSYGENNTGAQRVEVVDTPTLGKSHSPGSYAPLGIVTVCYPVSSWGKVCF